MNTGKIYPHHIAKQAYIYLRQSTMGQVRFNQESTQRQYALQDKAQQMGWHQTSIKILDGDLGVSGIQSSNREDFKTLVADVSMGKVGAIFALEASRLSRSCSDWHRLLELCAMTNTLIIDEDGCYNLSDFNDQMIMNFKGTISQAELHLIRTRLQGGKINKAKKGELKFSIPTGFCYDEKNRICLDPDEQVRHTVRLFFNVFKEKGSAYGVVCHFAQQELSFPTRPHGSWKEKLVWERLSESRARSILKNPSYAGVYVYGRHKRQKKLSETGRLQSSPITLPMDSWLVMIKDHHEGYISWDDYLGNQVALKQNRCNTKEGILPLSAREGIALLQGLLICGVCGYRFSPHYKGRGDVSFYACNKKRDGSASRCFSVNGKSLDQAISDKVLMAIKPAQIEIAIQAFEELEQRRAQYESQLAQRRYQEVDPSNRLVAATLEKDWNDALALFQEVQSKYDEYQKKSILTVAKEQKENLISLAKDFPRLWNAPSTSPKDRKRILRLLIKDITVEKKIKGGKKAILHIRWQGGALEDLEVDLPQTSSEIWKHSGEIINRVRELGTTLSNQQIAKKFNGEGLKTNKGNAFTTNTIRGIRYRYKIPSILPEPEELSIDQVAKKLNVSQNVVYSWIQRNMVSARRPGLKFWILLDPDKEAELKAIVKNSTKIAAVHPQYQKTVIGGVI